MQAEIIVIGDEILIGQTLDTNSQMIAVELNKRGIQVHQKRVIADERKPILEALEQVHPDTQLVFLTGGLGPTRDDITKQTLTEFFGGTLAHHPEVEAQVRTLFAGFNRTPTDANLQQAYVPSSCTVLPNKRGTAPGMRFEKDGRYYFSTPGVPYETEYLVKEEIMPWIDQLPGARGLFHKTFLTQGYPESILARKLEDWENQLSSSVTLAYLPSPGQVRLRLSGHSHSTEAARDLVQTQEEKLRALLGPIIFGTDDDTLPEVVGRLLVEHAASLSTAESCTGGHLAHQITSVPGSSRYFQGSIISYSNAIKQDHLQVSAADLAAHGAVSQPVVEQMARAARQNMGTDYALASSGVAGPGGGSAEKPVGYTWLALAGPEGVSSAAFHFGQHRQRNILRSSLMALDMLRRRLEGYPMPKSSA